MIQIDTDEEGIFARGYQGDKLREAGIRYLGDYSDDTIMYTVLPKSNRIVFDELMKEVSKNSGEKRVIVRYNNDIICLKDGKPDEKLNDTDKLNFISSILKKEYKDNPAYYKAMLDIMIGSNKLQEAAEKFESISEEDFITL